MPRLSITLTESQAATLDAIASTTGATKQSMIGLAISAWIAANGHLATTPAKTPEIASQAPEDETYINIVRDGVEVAWLRGRWESPEHKAVLATAMRYSRDGELVEQSHVWRYELADGDSYDVEDLYPEDTV